MNEPALPLARKDAGGVVLAVRVTPGASREGVEGMQTRDDGRTWLCVKVRAKPDKGAANSAVTALLAREFGLAKTAARVESGSSAREKLIRLDGEGEALARRLAELCLPAS